MTSDINQIAPLSTWDTPGVIIESCAAATQSNPRGSGSNQDGNNMPGSNCS